MRSARSGRRAASCQRQEVSSKGAKAIDRYRDLQIEVLVCVSSVLEALENWDADVRL